jgi:hypothetical protein
VDSSSFSAALAALLGRSHCHEPAHSEAKADHPPPGHESPGLVQRVHEAAHILRQDDKSSQDKQPEQGQKHGQGKEAEQDKQRTREDSPGAAPPSTDEQKAKSFTAELDRKGRTTGPREGEAWTEFLDRTSGSQSGNAGQDDSQPARDRNLPDEQQQQQGKDHSRGR